MIQKSLVKLYEESFKENWDLPALTDYTTGETVTYGGLAERIALTHEFFRELNVQPGAKMAVCGRDSSDWVVTYMAVITYGAVIVPILPDFNPVDITHIVNHSEAELLFVTDAIWEHIQPENLLNIKAAISLKRRSESLYQRDDINVQRCISMLRRRFKRRYPEGFGPDDVIYEAWPNNRLMEINYTSGTTGFSKGVMLLGNNLAGNVLFGISQRLHYRGSRVLGFLPLAHAYGCAFDMLTPLAVGSHITILGKTPSPRVLIKALAEVRPSLVICVPLILEKIYKNSILPMISKGPIRWTLAVPLLDTMVYAKIRKRLVDIFGGQFEEVIVGGAALNAEVEEFLHRIKFPFTVGCGMTECGPLVSYTPWRDFIPGSSGCTIPGMETKVLSDDPENVPGEICVRGENVMVGYYKNPDATGMVLAKDGWLHTGDMGTRTPDGTIFLRGRSKTMLLGPSGQNIYPEEIESKLNNMPYVAESLVVDRDGKLVALVYPDYSALDAMGISNSELEATFETVRKELNQLVAPYERITRIQLLPTEFEKTPKKSIKRFLYNQ